MTGEWPTLSALPHAVPKSAMPGMLWPALPDRPASRLLALQFQLEQSQWWPPELIEARQFEQLQQVLTHAQRTGLFYAARLGALASGATIDRARWIEIPILTRQEVQLNKESLRSRAVPEQPFSAQEEARLIEYIRHWAGPQFKVSLRVVDTIPHGPGGKFEEFMSLIEGHA